MNIKIKGERIFFAAVESLRFDSEKTEIVIRTVSGNEHRKKVENEDEANEVFDLIEANMEISGAI